VHSEGMSKSDGMSDSGGGPYYWCLKHNRVETDQDVCTASMTMGPCESPTERSRHDKGGEAQRAVGCRGRAMDWRTAVATHPDAKHYASS